MKATIEEDGTLVVIAENSVEVFSLCNWSIDKYALKKDCESYKKTCGVINNYRNATI